MPTIEINAEKLIKQFTKLAQFKHLKQNMKRAAIYVQGKAREYPPESNKPPKGTASAHWTDKQRKWFWANFKSGKLKIPYKRTQALRNAWVTQSRNDGFTQVVKNTSTHAQLVQGVKQTRYHAQTGWKTAEQVSQEEAETVREYIMQGIMQDLNDA